MTERRVELVPGLLDALKTTHGLKSDRALAREAGVVHTAITRVRSGMEPGYGLVVGLAGLMQTRDLNRVLRIAS